MFPEDRTVLEGLFCTAQSPHLLPLIFHKQYYSIDYSDKYLKVTVLIGTDQNIEIEIFAE